MASRSLLLFLIGLLLEVSAIALISERDAPLVLPLVSVVSPRYAEARSAVRELEAGRPLAEGDVGFSTLQRIFQAQHADRTPMDSWTPVVSEFRAADPVEDWDRTRWFVRDVEVRLGGYEESPGASETIDWELSLLRDAVARARGGAPFAWAAAVFAAGALLQTWAFLAVRANRGRRDT